MERREREILSSSSLRGRGERGEEGKKVSTPTTPERLTEGIFWGTQDSITASASSRRTEEGRRRGGRLPDMEHNF